MARDPARIFFQTDLQHTGGHLQSLSEKVSDGNTERGCPPVQGIQAQRSFEVFDSDISFSGPEPEPTASTPTDGETWIQLQRSIHEKQSWLDVPLEVTKDVGDSAEDKGIIAADLEGS